MGDKLAVEIMNHVPHALDSTSWRMLVLIAREPDYTMGTFHNRRIIGELVRPEPTGLYRLYGKAGDILYVGISWHPGKRFVQHARTKPWWLEVKSYELKWYADRPTAESTETGLIRKLRPPYNRTDMPTPYRPSRRPLSAA